MRPRSLLEGVCERACVQACARVYHGTHPNVPTASATGTLENRADHTSAVSL